VCPWPGPSNSRTIKFQEIRTLDPDLGKPSCDMQFRNPMLSLSLPFPPHSFTHSRIDASPTLLLSRNSAHHSSQSAAPGHTYTSANSIRRTTALETGFGACNRRAFDSPREVLLNIKIIGRANHPIRRVLGSQSPPDCTPASRTCNSKMVSAMNLFPNTPSPFPLPHA
jgi:hypothetical protein